MNPSAPLVLLTSVKINNYLKEQKQHESFISEAWVFKTLQTHIRNSIETGLIMSDAEVSDRVASIAIRRLQANITAASRFAKDQQYLYRPFDERNQDLSANTFAQIPERGEMALRERRHIGNLPDRFIDYKS